MDPPVKSVMQLQLMGKTQHPIGHGIYHDISKPRNQNRHAATQSVGRLLSTNRDLRLESFVGRESFVQGIDIFYIFSFGVTVFASKKTESMKSGALLPYCWVPPARVHSSGYPVAGTRMRKAVMSRCGSDREHIKVTFFFGILQFYKKRSSEHGGWRSIFHNMMIMMLLSLPHYKGDNCYRRIGDSCEKKGLISDDEKQLPA